METLSSRYEMAIALIILAVVTYKIKLSKIPAKMGTTMFRPHSY